MSVYSTYAEILMENVILDLVKSGSNVTATNVQNTFDTLTASHDLSTPWFSASSIIESDISSASSFNNSLSLADQDINVSFKHLFKQSARNNSNYIRWQSEIGRLSAQFKDLKSRLDNLILTIGDSAGYLNYVYDSLSTGSKIDSSNSTVYFDSKNGEVTLGATDYIEKNSTVDSVQFSLLSQNYLISIAEPSLSDIDHVIDTKNNFWHKNITLSQPSNVSVEVLIKLKSTQSINKISVDLHSSNTRSLMSVTPMYSTDGYNYSQLPITSFTKDILDKTAFRFNNISAKYIKILLTKFGYDYVDANQGYVYEFGLNHVGLYSSTHSTDTSSILYSSVLSANDKSGNPIQFTKLALDVCESKPTNTSINYSVAVSNTSTTTLASRTYYNLSPIGKSDSIYPTVLEPGKLNTVTVSGVSVSYDSSQSASLISPAKNYSSISAISGSVVTTSTVQSSLQRYIFTAPTLKLLDYSIDTSVNVATPIEVWRNVAVRGSEVKVRDSIRGWRQAGDWYTTSVYVDNKVGIIIDFGNKPIILDDTSAQGIVSISQGAHTISIHKDNFKTFSMSSVTSIALLKAADSLYPYNHRYLVEGVSYSTAWTDEKKYVGFDIVAEYKMKQTSVFDIVSNTSKYNFFAIDRDLPDTAAIINGASSSRSAESVVLLHVDTSYSDFVNEKFTFRLKSLEQQYKYIWLKAVLSTESNGVAPSIDSYRIKLTN